MEIVEIVKMQVVSDLHLEFYNWKHIVQELLTHASEAKYLILAGDISPYGKNGGRLKLFLTELQEGPWEKIFLVPGNHEYYSPRSLSEINLGLEKICSSLNVTFLFQRRISLEDGLLLGTTLWGDLDSTQETELLQGCSDFHSIHTVSSEYHQNLKVRSSKKLSFSEYRDLHQRDAQWLEEQIFQETSGKPISVITHHPPIFLGSKRDELSSAYSGQMEHLLKYVKIWICGHHHEYVDKYVDGCRIVCHPRGYPHEFEKNGYQIGFQI